jgi:hypothetical protein
MLESLAEIPTFQICIGDAGSASSRAAAKSPPVTRVAGLDARARTRQETCRAITDLGFSVDIDKIRRREGYLPSRTQLACAVGHRLAWRLMLSTDAPYALILEEDAVPTGSAADVDATMSILRSERAAVVQLSCRSEIFPARPIRLKRPTSELVELRYPPRQTTAYLINRQAALLGVNSPLDGLADWPGFATSVDFWALLPWMFKESGATSTVDLGTGGLASVSRWRRLVHALPFSFEHLYRVSLPTLDAWLWRRRGRPRAGNLDELWIPSVPHQVAGAAKVLARKMDSQRGAARIPAPGDAL